MAAHCSTANMDGFANHFLVQAQEEHFHAMKFFNFVNDRGGKVELKAITAPKVHFKSLIEIFEETLEHEKKVTASINNLMDIAIKEKDHALISFLKWYVDEQVEEESTVGKILHKLKLIGGDGHGLLMIDNELAAKVFTPPAQNA
jgi:ferritin